MVLRLILGASCLMQTVQDVLPHSSLRHAVRASVLLLVFVKTDHLFDQWLGHLVQRGQGIRGDRHIDVAQLPNDRLQLQIVNAV